MLTKSIVAPTGIEKGHYWFSPDGVSPPWQRVWNGTAWRDFEEEDLDEDESTDEDDPPTEESNDEQGMQTAVSDSDGGEQGASGKPEPEPKQRGKRGKVFKGGKGK